MQIQLGHDPNCITPLSPGMSWQPAGSSSVERVVVVAGGYNDVDGNLASVEMLYLDSRSGLKWVPGPGLHNPVWSAQLVEFGSSVILTGGSGKLELPNLKSSSHSSTKFF